MAVERELDKTETNIGNIVFDESGYMILYSTMLGVKLVNLYTNKCIRIMGKPENIRPMQLALFQVYFFNGVFLSLYLCLCLFKYLCVGQSKKNCSNCISRNGSC